MAKTTEKRGNSLLLHVRNCISGCGNLKLNGRDGRKANFMFRGLHYEVTSRLNVKEIELAPAETPMTEKLTLRLKGANA
tara:strand:- start:3250 stop:3486 length:237 start_codon:yes stop_codon:yes gene_type:complete